METFVSPNSTLLFTALEAQAFGTSTSTPITAEIGNSFDRAFTEFNHNNTDSVNKLDYLTSCLDRKESTFAEELASPTASISLTSTENLTSLIPWPKIPLDLATEPDKARTFDSVFESEIATLKPSHQLEDNTLFRRAIDARFEAARKNVVHQSKKHRILIDPVLADPNPEVQEDVLRAIPPIQNLAVLAPNADESQLPTILITLTAQALLPEIQAQSKSQCIAPASDYEFKPQEIEERITKPKRRRNRKRKQLTQREKDEKHKAFLDRNRIAAGKCRNKKREWLQQLEEDAREKERLNLKLKIQVCRLMDEIQTLSGLLEQCGSKELRHSGYSCKHLSSNVEEGIDGEDTENQSEMSNIALPE